MKDFPISWAGPVRPVWTTGQTGGTCYIYFEPPQQLKFKSLSLPLSLTSTPSLTFTLSLSVPHRALPLPTPKTPNLPSQLDLKIKKASNRHGELSSPRGPPRDALDFKFFVRRKARSRYSNLCRPDLSFQKVLSDFLGSIISICIPQLGSKRVLILVG